MTSASLPLALANGRRGSGANDPNGSGLPVPRLVSL
jgi:hypothetical protein